MPSSEAPAPNITSTGDMCVLHFPNTYLSWVLESQRIKALRPTCVVKLLSDAQGPARDRSRIMPGWWYDDEWDDDDDDDDDACAGNFAFLGVSRNATQTTMM